MRTGYLAIGLAAVVSVVAASCSQDSRVSDPGNSAGTLVQVEEWQMHQGFGNNTGNSREVPVGSVSVGPGSVEGEPVYENAGGVNGTIGRPDQPAGW